MVPCSALRLRAADGRGILFSAHQDAVLTPTSVWGTSIVTSPLTPAQGNAVDIAARLLTAAKKVYGLNDAQMGARVIDESSISWHVGDFTVIFNASTDLVFFAGSNWSATVDPHGNNLSLSGVMNGEGDDGVMTIGVREFFALIVASATIQHPPLSLEL